MTLIRCTVSRDIWYIFYGVYLVTYIQLKTRTHLTNRVVSDTRYWIRDIAQLLFNLYNKNQFLIYDK